MITALDVLDNLMYPRSYGTYSINDRSYTTTTLDDGLQLSIDVPGVKAEDIRVEADHDNCIIITARRSDKKVIDDRFKINMKYDASSAKPKLELGVLTIEFKQSEARKRKLLPIATA